LKLGRVNLFSAAEKRFRHRGRSV